jgi:hypothetical protein
MDSAVPSSGAGESNWVESPGPHPASVPATTSKGAFAQLFTNLERKVFPLLSMMKPRQEVHRGRAECYQEMELTAQLETHENTWKNENAGKINLNSFSWDGGMGEVFLSNLREEGGCLRRRV